MGFRIADVSALKGATFRVMDHDGIACRKSICCRVDWHDDDWRIQLFADTRGAEQNWRPMSFVSREILDLAIHAMEHARTWIDIQEREAERT